MHVLTHAQPGLLKVKVGEKALVRPPEWEEVLALRGPDTVLVVLDLREADFISSLFLQGCVDLSRVLADAGQQLALLHLSPYQERLLELVEGASRLLVLSGEEQVSEQLAALRVNAEPGGTDEGVTPPEKTMLWG
jgi:anti-anti-sigma regulatory factor